MIRNNEIKMLARDSASVFLLSGESDVSGSKTRENVMTVKSEITMSVTGMLKYVLTENVNLCDLINCEKK